MNPYEFHLSTETIDDLRQRLERVQAGMSERGLGGLIVYTSGQHNMLRMDQVHYLTDFRVLGHHAILLVPKAGLPKLLVTPSWDHARARESTWLSEVWAVDDDDLPALVAQLARDMPPPIGLSGREEMPVRFAIALQKALGTPLLEASGLLPAIGAVRTPIEIARLRRAAEIADKGFQALYEAARVGIREYELAAEVEMAMSLAGAEDNFGMISAALHNTAVRPPSDRELTAGDVIICEITPCYKGHFAQLCRTIVLGKPTPLQHEKYELLIRAQECGMAAAVPGRLASDIARTIDEVMINAGYAEYCRQPYMRSRGHAMGFGAIIPRDLAPDNHTVLREGMAFVIHPNQYIPETGYLMAGDTVVLEPTGPTRLTQTPLQLFWKDI